MWFLQPSSKHNSLVAVIINLMWREKKDFEISSQRKGENVVSWQNGQWINHCIPETIKFDFSVLLFRIAPKKENASMASIHMDAIPIWKVTALLCFPASLSHRKSQLTMFMEKESDQKQAMAKDCRRKKLSNDGC